MQARWPLLLAGTVIAVGCGGAGPATEVANAVVDPAVLAMFDTLPARIESSANPITPEKVALGRMLYFDTRFSAGNDVSCYVCHPLHDYGTTHRMTGVGHDQAKGGRNEPTVYNAAGHLAQFWDGRAADVEAQALGPVLNPVEMAMPAATEVVAGIKAIPGYVEAFRAAFPGEADPVTFDNFGRAIGAFERGLVTPSRWDAFLEGDATALTTAEQHGLQVFVSTGCLQCHSGPYVGGGMYQKAGLAEAWPNQSDPGRFQVTGQEGDRMVFKVPSLRNVEETWPYFHDGSVQRLQDAVQMMARYQLGKELGDTDVEALVTWLKTLTGPVPESYIQEPTLPATPPAGSSMAGASH